MKNNEFTTLSNTNADRDIPHETKLKKFKVTFIDYFDAETEEDCYKQIIDYLKECVEYEDLMAFEVNEVKERKKK